MPIVLCRALGPLQLTVDELPAPAPLLWRKSLALLLHLLRSPHRSRSREQLVGLLWPEVPEEKAKHSLNEALSKLRRAGGDHSIDSTGEFVALGPQFRCDVDDFETAIASGDWESAAALCGGEFAEGLTVPGANEFDQWLETERRHWRTQGLLALVNWAQHLLDRGRTAAALEVARRALALDPLSDRAVRMVMRALLLLGDWHGAVETGHAFQERLALELQAHLDPETRALLDHAASMPQSPRGERPDEGPHIPLVGREQALLALNAAFERVRSAHEAALVVVTGEPGTGVSRLLLELSVRAHHARASVSRMVAVDADCDRPWSGVEGLALGGLLDAPGIAGAPAASLGTLAARLAPWRERFAASAPLAGDSPALALAEVVAAAADERPVLLLLDDAQRLDEESLRCLPLLLRRWRTLPVMLVVGASPQPERPTLDALRIAAGRDLPGGIVSIGPLSVEAIRQLAQVLLPGYSPTELDRVVRRVVTDSAGIALLVLELLLAVSRGLELGQVQRAWPATSATLDDSLPGDIPEALVAAMRVNFSRLTPEAREVLKVASVASDRVGASELARGAALDRAKVDLALDELEWQHWLSADARGYSFVARLWKRVVAEQMLTMGQRRRILERLVGDVPQDGSEGT